MNKRFSTAYLKYELDLPWDAVSKEVVDTDRWSLTYDIVFEDQDGTFWRTWYSVGATELQDQGPWEYEDEVDAIQVELREVLVSKWMPVETPQ